MKVSAADSPSLWSHFQSLEDPRAEHLIEHQLLDIIALTLCAVICGAESWVEIELYGKTKEDWLKSFLTLPNGIPSHDTIARLFAAMNPDSLSQCFARWVRAIAQVMEGDVIAIDGKTLRHSYDRGGNTNSLKSCISQSCVEPVPAR